MKIVLYTTGCPQCKVLEAKLNDKNIQFKISNDIDEIIKMGFMSAPILQVDNTFMHFADAVKWVNGR